MTMRPAEFRFYSVKQSAAELRYDQWAKYAPPTVAMKLCDVPLTGNSHRAKLMRGLMAKARNFKTWAEARGWSEAEIHRAFWFERVHEELQELGIWVLIS